MPTLDTNHDPITRLTDSEKTLVNSINENSNRIVVLERLKDDLQTAVEVELATIPIYLYTYYSLIRNKVSGENMGPAQQYVNKAGGVIMSVAVEEMLHMSLASNILFSLGVAPRLYKKSPGPYPTGLPHHQPKGPMGPNGTGDVSIPLAKLSYEQLWHFLQIEYPEPAGAWPKDRNWSTIGQLYSNIRCLISTQFILDADFQVSPLSHQIQDYNYSPNNIDTLYPADIVNKVDTGGQFDPWKPAPPADDPWVKSKCPSASEATTYPNMADSHVGPTQLLSVNSRLTAMEAIDTICDQGEGYAQPRKNTDKTDDPSKSENSHYYKFLTLQAQFSQYANHKEDLAPSPKAPDQIEPHVWVNTLSETGLGKPPSGAINISTLVVNFPNNPKTCDYPVELQPISNFCNALFQYMLIMTETVYRVPPENQKLFFNEGLHRSMIWVLDKYIQTMRKIPIVSGKYKGTYLAPTFETVDLGEQKTSFSTLTRLGSSARLAAENIIRGSSVEIIVEPDVEPGLPDILQQLKQDIQNPEYAKDPVRQAMKNVIYYVGSAISETSDGHAMHLPDVGKYW